jgi:hypothetical protein
MHVYIKQMFISVVHEITADLKAFFTFSTSRGSTAHVQMQFLLNL